MQSFLNQLQIICLESEAFYALIDEVVERISKEQGDQSDQWIDDEEAMNLLKVTSKTTLQKYRDERKIRFSQPSKKVILYDRHSILEFLNQNAHEPWT